MKYTQDNVCQNVIDEKIKTLLMITDEFIFPEYYSHEECDMWKINNTLTNYNKETIVLCRLDEGVERALDLAIEAIGKKRDEYNLLNK